MKYIPAVAGAVAISAAIIAGFYYTKDPICLLGLFAFVYLKYLVPKE